MKLTNANKIRLSRAIACQFVNLLESREHFITIYNTTAICNVCMLNVSRFNNYSFLFYICNKYPKSIAVSYKLKLLK